MCKWGKFDSGKEYYFENQLSEENLMVRLKVKKRFFWTHMCLCNLFWSTQVDHTNLFPTPRWPCGSNFISIWVVLGHELAKILLIFVVGPNLLYIHPLVKPNELSSIGECFPMFHAFVANRSLPC